MDLLQVSQVQGRVPITVFHLQDRVNLGNYAELERVAKDAYDNGTRNLVVDLGQTPSITSIGIRAIIFVYKLLTDQGGRLTLANPTPYIREVLDIAGIADTLEIYDTVDAAVASF